MSKWFIFDDIVPEQYQDFLCTELDPQKLNWVFHKDITYTGDAEQIQNPAFVHAVYANNTVLSTSHYFLLPILFLAAARQNLEITSLVRIKINLFPNRAKVEPNVPHVDFPSNHWVLLYYPFESDGDTVFYDRENHKLEIGRVSPKRGRVLLFDGSLLHSSSNPCKHTDRITVNYNFTV